MMTRQFKRRLLHTALLSSPILAVYGVTPVYLFRPVPFLTALNVFSLLTLLALLFWLINIYVLSKTAHTKPGKRYVISYTLSLLLVVLVSAITPDPPVEDIENKFFVIYPILFILAINTIIIIISNSLLLAEKKASAEMEVEQLRISNLEAQKQVLMQQLQPHFLFNTLSVLKSLIRESPDEAENYAVKLSEFLRYTVDVHKSTLVTLEDELKFTNDYIELQKVRFETALITSTVIPEEAYSMKMPAYALQTLVENAIKHNAFTVKKPLYINIEYTDNAIRVSNNKMLCKVENTTGTGLKNLDDRYRIITGQGIAITDARDEYCVTVKLIPNAA